MPTSEVIGKLRAAQTMMLEAGAVLQGALTERHTVDAQFVLEIQKQVDSLSDLIHWMKGATPPGIYCRKCGLSINCRCGHRSAGGDK